MSFLPRQHLLHKPNLSQTAPRGQGPACHWQLWATRKTGRMSEAGQSHVKLLHFVQKLLNKYTRFPPRREQPSPRGSGQASRSELRGEPAEQSIPTGCGHRACPAQEGSPATGHPRASLASQVCSVLSTKSVPDFKGQITKERWKIPH